MAENNTTDKTAISTDSNTDNTAEVPTAVETETLITPIDNSATVEIPVKIDPLQGLEDGQLLPMNTLVAHRVREITQELLKTAEGRMAHTLAYINQIQNLLDRLGIVQGGLLAIAEELQLYLPRQIVGMDQRTITEEKLPITIKGLYDTNQLQHIVALVLNRLIRIKHNRQENTLDFGRVQSQVDDLTKKLVARDDQLKHLQELPPPPALNEIYVLYYRDNKNRDNYIGHDTIPLNSDKDYEISSVFRTRQLRQAIHFTDLKLAARDLLSIMELPEPIINNLHLYEIVSLHTMVHSFNELPDNLRKNLIEARGLVLQKELDSSPKKKKRPNKDKKSRRTKDK
jgi:hypothetical protein